MLDFLCYRNNNNLSVGDKVVTVEDILYCTKDDIDADVLKDYKTIMDVKPWGDLIIPEGMIMEYCGIDEDGGGWPVFKIKNIELVFASDIPVQLIKLNWKNNL